MVVLLMPESARRERFSPESQRFLAYLEAHMGARGFGSNRSKLARYMEEMTGYGSVATVNAWFSRGTVPGDDGLAALAAVLRRPLDEVRAAAGKPVETPREQPTLPEWLTSVLEELRGYELRVVEATAHGLLRARGERGQGEDQAPPAEGEDEQPPPAPRRRREPRR
jgi:hypothetical protein